MNIMEYVKGFECDIVESSVNRRRKYFPDEIECVANIEFENIDNYRWLIKHTYIIFEETEEELEKKIEEGKDLGVVKLIAFLELDMEEELFEKLDETMDSQEIELELAKIANFLSFPKCKEVSQQLLRTIDAPYIAISMPQIKDVIIHGDDDNVGQPNS